MVSRTPSLCVNSMPPRITRKSRRPRASDRTMVATRTTGTLASFRKSIGVVASQKAMPKGEEVRSVPPQNVSQIAQGLEVQEIRAGLIAPNPKSWPDTKWSIEENTPLPRLRVNARPARAGGEGKGHQSLYVTFSVLPIMSGRIGRRAQTCVISRKKRPKHLPQRLKPIPLGLLF